MNNTQLQNIAGHAIGFVTKWLAVSVVVYFGFTKLAPWIDAQVPF
jgi:hypothetical protein